MSDPASISLTEWLESLRTELSRAQRTAPEDGLRLQVDKVELEIEVVSTRDVGAKGGVKFWVLDAAADGKRSSGTTQRLRLSLTPTTADGASLKVSDELNQRPQ